MDNKSVILVVEDNEDLRENAVLVLSLEDYTVFSAPDGQEALDMLTSGECDPDLIVSDIAMPRLDGYGFFEAVRNIPVLRTVPFIFLTARGSRQDVRFGKELGVDDYLIKPFNADDFLVAVKNKLRRAQEIREDAENRLDEARRTLIQLLSHELRTPLTYVTGGFTLLAEGLQQEELPADLQVSMGLIRSGTQRLNHLAEQFVLYAELISGQSRLHLQKLGEMLDLESILRGVVVSLTREAAARRIHVRYMDQLPQPVEVYTVSDLLRTAFYEVIRNAIGYGAENGEVVVTVGLEAETGFAVVEVIDYGRGIALEDQESVWNILVQSDRSKHEQQGAGMGLPIVKQIMILHGGTAQLQSEQGKGTLVRLRLPINTEP